MTTKTQNPLQPLVNAQAIRLAEAQYRLATLFTPYGFQPERIDYDRVAAFLDNPERAFPQPTDGIRTSLDRIKVTIAEARGILAALAAQCEPDLSEDQLFVTAQANVSGNRMNTAAYNQVA